VVLDLDSMVVADAGVVTAGAAFAHIDLALALVRRVSPGLAEHVARLLVIDERASQSAYLVTDHLNHNDPVVLAFEQQAAPAWPRRWTSGSLPRRSAPARAPSSGAPRLRSA
jgi:transcriptional regulator GlxA family with amidase domain